MTDVKHIKLSDNDSYILGKALSLIFISENDKMVLHHLSIFKYIIDAYIEDVISIANHNDIKIHQNYDDVYHGEKIQLNVRETVYVETFLKKIEHLYPEEHFNIISILFKYFDTHQDAFDKESGLLK